MKVYPVIDNDTDKIINIHASFDSAKSEFKTNKKITICEFDLIDTLPKMKSIAEVDKKVYDPLHFNDAMPYGKYKGQTVGSIIQSDPEYLQWCQNNVSLSLDEDCCSLLEASLEK